jgi:leucyl-tRNA synthetase
LIFEGQFKVFIVATARNPEALYGQTNVWVDPNLTYGAYQINETDVFICTERVAWNMCFQGLSTVPKCLSMIAELSCDELIGLPVRAPLSKFLYVYILPLESRSKGTGVSASVPSVDPLDYVAYQELKINSALRKKYKIKDEAVDLEIVPVISVSGYGDMIGPSLCKATKVRYVA